MLQVRSIPLCNPGSIHCIQVQWRPRELSSLAWDNGLGTVKGLVGQGRRDQPMTQPKTPAHHPDSPIETGSRLASTLYDLATNSLNILFCRGATRNGCVSAREGLLLSHVFVLIELRNNGF